MTGPERATTAWLKGRFEGHEELLEALCREGLIDRREAERRAIRSAVGELNGRGLGRCEAMEVVAQAFCCSYEKVRAAVYQKQF